MRKFKLRIGHKKDQFFVQEKSQTNQRYEIISIHYNQSHANEELAYLKATANKK